VRALRLSFWAVCLPTALPLTFGVDGQRLLGDPDALRPAILSREEWGAKPANPPWREHSPKRITIHHAGVPTNRARSFEDKLRGLQAFSQREDRLASGQSKPVWPDIPYHWYVDWQGRIAECRDPLLSGDTNTEYDPSGHLLICLEGSFGEEQPTGEQIRSLDRLVLWLAAKYRVAPELIGGHKDFAKTECPGSNLYAEIARIRKRLEIRLACAGFVRE